MEALSISATLLCCDVLHDLGLLSPLFASRKPRTASCPETQCGENALLWNNNGYNYKVDKGQRLGYQLPGSPKYE
jgi:hypothetical protein